MGDRYNASVSGWRFQQQSVADEGEALPDGCWALQEWRLPQEPPTPPTLLGGSHSS